MQDSTVSTNVVSIGSKDVLNEILRQGAQQMLATAIESEVAEYLAQNAHQLDTKGKRQVVRNGYLPTREIQTGLGQVTVRRPRVNDKREDEEGNRMRFSSKVLPPYLRRSKNIDELIPGLYLRGISTGDFTNALQALLGPQAKGLSGQQYCPTQGRLTAGMDDLVPTVPDRQAVCVFLG